MDDWKEDELRDRRQRQPDAHLRDELCQLADKLEEARVQVMRIANGTSERVMARDMPPVVDDIVLALTKAVNIQHEAPQ